VVGIDLRSSPDATVEWVLGDVSDQSVLRQARERGEQLGELSAWVNCAGVPETGSLLASNPARVTQVVDINQMAYFWGCVEATESFVSHGVAGSIVNVSSIHGTRGFHGWAVYDMCKGAVDALTRSVAVEFASAGVRCNAVAPGSVSTALAEQLAAADGNRQGVLSEAASIAPMARMAHPEEIAEAIAWLVESATFVTGQVLAVDGGATAWIPTKGLGHDAG
jgi:NAD(P)-dependent dehydrogenase (short-subunit alcohol dehydrogenase family)